MPKWTAISKDQHGTKLFRPLPDFAFAAQAHLVPVGYGELSHVLASFPLALVPQGEATSPVAVLGLEPGISLFVDSNGRWLAPYVPASLRAYPFRLVRDAQGNGVLCVDEESGTLHDDAAQGTPLYDDQGEPSPFIREILRFLTGLEADLQRSRRAASHLKDAGLLAPWPITVKTPAGEKTFQGLFQVDESRLMELGAEDLKALRDSGALTLAFAQRFSVRALSNLTTLYDRRAAAAPVVPAQDTIDLSALRTEGKTPAGASPEGEVDDGPAPDPKHSGEEDG